VRAYGRSWTGRHDLYVAVQPRVFREKPLPDGSFQIKVAWFRRVPGKLSTVVEPIGGRGQGHALISDAGYPPIGPLPTTVEISGPGCWRVTSTLRNTRVTAVIRVAAAT
jgi:hypothetical protein